MATKKKKAPVIENELLTGFTDLLDGVGEDEDLDTKILDLLKEQFGGDHGMLLEPEVTTGNLREVAKFGEIEEMLNQDMRNFTQFTMDHPEDPDFVVVAPDAKKVQKLAARKSVRRDMTKQVLIFPLTAGDEAMGVVYLGSKDGKSLKVDGLTQESVLEFGKTFGKILKIDRAIQRVALQNQSLQRTVSGEAVYQNLVGSSESVERIKRALALVEATDIPVTLVGETGTGKAMLAQILHNNSGRKKKPFIHLQINEIPEKLLEITIFGRASRSSNKAVRGALRDAKGGTLFIQDVDKLPLRLQAQLQQAIENGEAFPLQGDNEYPVDVRLVASTESNLATLFEENKIREDLYQRLSIFPILIPPLRDRTEDLPVLVPHFIDEAAAAFGKAVSGVNSEVYDYLGTYDWPGNITELEKEIRQAVLRAPDRGGVLTPSSLSKHLISKREPAISLPKEGTLKQRIAGIEKRLIMEALEQYKHNQSTTADRLGLSRQALINKLHRYGIETGRKYKRRLREIEAKAEITE
ncbi:sigma 54-interacting transcriptional regulator [bacterium]|nr:sigma 54-interacting transcriptional regulator [bacterium]